MIVPFADRLARAVKDKGNPVCVGLDPRWEQLPAQFRALGSSKLAQRADAYRVFCCDIIDVVSPLVPCVKPQAAFFEELGPAGMTALHAVMQYARSKQLMIILDGKRNDIGSTADAYARAYLGGADPDGWQADALTVSPYLGDDSLEPFVSRCQDTSTGIFVLVKTSNRGGKFLQDVTVDQLKVSDRVANWVESQSFAKRGETGYGPIGAVVGATYPEELATLRERMPSAWILIPGYGAQGGSAEDVRAGFDADGLGAIVNSSRGIIFAYEKDASIDRWQSSVEHATKSMIQQLHSVGVHPNLSKS